MQRNKIRNIERDEFQDINNCNGAKLLLLHMTTDRLFLDTT